MSSHQWRTLRHLLSNSSLGAELDKLLQRVKPTSPEYWDNAIKRLESALWSRLYGESQQAIKQSQALTSTATSIQPQEQVEENKTERQSTVPAPSSAPSPAPSPASGGAPTLAETESVPSHLSDLSLDKLWQGLRLKKDLTLGNVSQPSWKANKGLATKSSIQSRTSHVVQALEEARSPESAARRCAELAEHLLQHPAAREQAVRAGAVRALLRLQAAHRRQPAVLAAAREALALAGWAAPPRAPGPRVLAIDGGGVRGLVAIEILRALEAHTGRPARDLFDFIVGVSTGAIVAAVVAGEAGSLDEAAALYRSLARDMFGDTTVLGGASRLVWTRAYYDTQRWENMLRERLGERSMTAGARDGRPRLALVSARAEPDGRRLAPYVFRSYGGAPRRHAALAGGAAARVWEAVRASAAAPTYFEELALGGARHSDGGLLCNNPAGVALVEARLQYGDLRRAVLVSVGTGRAPRGGGGGGAGAGAVAGAAGWRDRFEAVLESATDTERVHVLLSELLPAGGYFRLNPALTAPCAMDEVREERLAAVAADTRLYLRRNEAKLRAVAAALTRPRPLAARAADALRTHAVRLGLVNP